MKCRAGLANKIRGSWEFSVVTAKLARGRGPKASTVPCCQGKMQTITSCKLIAPWQEMCAKYPPSPALGQGKDEANVASSSCWPATRWSLSMPTQPFQTPIDLPREEELVSGPRKDEVNGRVQKLKPPRLQGPQPLQRAPVLGTS